MNKKPVYVCVGLTIKQKTQSLFDEFSYSVKHFEFGKYAQHSKNTTVTLENLLNNLLKKDTKKILSHSKFRRLTKSIENNYSINKNAMINNASLYQ